MKMLKRPRGIYYSDNEGGQATVEYAIVIVVLLAIIAGLWSLFALADSGALVDHARSSASHSLDPRNAVGVIGDVLLY